MSRKGISPIIAVVLLLMMTVAAAGAAFFWMTTIQSRIQGQIGTQTAQTMASAKQFKIVSAECSSTAPTSINVTILNVGESSIDKGLTALTIMDTDSKILATNTSEIANNILSGQIEKIQYFVSVTLTQNKTYGLKVTLPGGAEQTTTCIAK